MAPDAATPSKLALGEGGDIRVQTSQDPADDSSLDGVDSPAEQHRPMSWLEREGLTEASGQARPEPY